MFASVAIASTSPTPHRPNLIEGDRTMTAGIGPQRTYAIGTGSTVGSNNAIYTSKYNIFNFLPIVSKEGHRIPFVFHLPFPLTRPVLCYYLNRQSVREQFRRNGNLYFLVMGALMFVGTYTPIFESSVSPWTTLGPLAVVVAISLAQEGAADAKRHRSDRQTNNHRCVVLRRADRLEEKAERDENIMDGNDIEVELRSESSGPKFTRKSIATIEDGQNLNVQTELVSVAFLSIRRMDMRAGDIVLVKNREMVPADIILLGSSGENGAAYIETSPIDGETNLKLRSVPQLPIEITEASTPRNLGKSLQSGKQAPPVRHPTFETIERAVKRVTRISLLGFPEGVGASRNPNNPGYMQDTFVPSPPKRQSFPSLRSPTSDLNASAIIDANTTFVTSITSEAPNASVNTFSGKITLPPLPGKIASTDIPLGAENILLRGAVLRNTEWAIGVACFTGADTKLARNSIKTPSKFSKLDVLMNRTVVVILFIMLVCVVGLSVLAVAEHEKRFDEMWYASYNKEAEKWPYLPDLEAPDWRTKKPPFFSFIFTFITLLNNFVPLSLYVTVEVITLFMMQLINWDKDMYHKETDTPAAARSTIVTDLGQVKYVFSDKTGTLTQNVMKFKRCSVDGLIFGAPVEKAAPGDSFNDAIQSDFEVQAKVFHPLKRLLIGSVGVERVDDGEDGVSIEVSTTTEKNHLPEDKRGFLTFNAEMFLRVMSICHTVVVEKEIDASNINKCDDSVASSGMGTFLKFKNRSRNNTDDIEPRHGTSRLGALIETAHDSGDHLEFESVRTPFSLAGDSNHEHNTGRSVATNTSNRSRLRAKDGAPGGYAYQAESPDEGALVEAASNEYDFQLIARNSDGVKVSCTSPSLLSVAEISNGLRNGKLSAKQIAAETASPTIGNNTSTLQKIIFEAEKKLSVELPGSAHETWKVLAVNKFDSDRKRMSVLVRSPANMGSIPMLMCKGADSSMLEPEICEGGMHLMSADGHLGQSFSSVGSKEETSAGDEWEVLTLLNMQSQLGMFASEGLRTLVLGVRFLTENECADWLAQYEQASTSIADRRKLLRAAAKAIETKLHIVGATAIEDKLQEGVPEAIYNIGRAGIKLWVLTGDKRETAIEIGYSTKVLHPKMHLTDVADGSEKRVKALVAMEFMRLVKIGKLLQYQKEAIQAKEKTTVWSLIKGFFKAFGKGWRSMSRARRRFYHTYIRTVFGMFFKERSTIELANIIEEEKQEKINEAKFQQVRQLAEKLLDEYLESPEGRQELAWRRKTSTIHATSTDFDGGADLLPAVFNRAESARASMDLQEGKLSQSVLRSLTLGSFTADSLVNQNKPVVDEDTLSLMSFVPGKSGAPDKIFNKKKRTLLEKLFAVDRDVRKGNLVKHLTKEKKAEYYSEFDILPQASIKDVPDGNSTIIDRALVIEGSALVHFLDDELLKEMLFAVASNCESVIACRVSPKQKALLVNLVKQFVQPEPVTLAIGDGANDVGMIQEAQVGIGISGLEGQQAVNASDFSIAQFRFLEDLLLIHGRWNFMRLSKTVLFSFYKNAVLAGLLMAYCRSSFYSGTPLFDMVSLAVPHSTFALLTAKRGDLTNIVSFFRYSVGTFCFQFRLWVAHNAIWNV